MSWKWTFGSATKHSDLDMLLAEDNQVNQMVALLMLKKLGYRADVVSNGREVLPAWTVTSPKPVQLE
jgi:CheY-like chemotaxis protein